MALLSAATLTIYKDIVNTYFLSLNFKDNKVNINNSK